MTKAEIMELAKNEEILYIYRIPCSYFEEDCLIIVGGKPIKKKGVLHYTSEEWFNLLNIGSLIPYVCAIAPKQNKIKVTVTVYQKPDLLLLRKYLFTHELLPWRIIQECLWAKQIWNETRVNRVDVFKNIKVSKTLAKKYLQEFLTLIEPMYKKRIEDDNK